MEDGKNTSWECECGYVAFGMYPPEECKECWKINSFVQIHKDDEFDEEEELTGGPLI